MSSPGRSGRAAPSELVELAAFCAAALARHADLRRRNGAPVPALVLPLARMCTEAARGSTTMQNLDQAGRPGEGEAMPSLLLDFADVGRLLKISRRTVATMAKDGRLRVVRIGSAVRVRRADVDALVNGQPATARFLDRAEVKDTDADQAV